MQGVGDAMLEVGLASSCGGVEAGLDWISSERDGDEEGEGGIHGVGVSVLDELDAMVSLPGAFTLGVAKVS